MPGLEVEVEVAAELEVAAVPGESPGAAAAWARARRRSGTRDSEIVGNPIGREALLSELAFEMVPYSPEELVEIANKEFAWCEAEMKKASREMGFGDDWKAALEKVKTMYVEPGQQPTMIRDLAIEAVEYLDANNLVTIPQLCRDSWRMDMMSPERQLVNRSSPGARSSASRTRSARWPMIRR